jgi:hypothetical protein
MTEETTQIEATTAAPPAEFLPLDPRVIRLWRTTRLITSGLLLLALLIAALIFGWKLPGAMLWIALGWLALALLCGWYSWWRPPRAYRAWGYRLDAKVLETRRGLMFQVTRLLPLTRLQHVDLERGPFERLFGLASLVLHTAGTHEASIIIPGLDAAEAVRLRNHLVEIGGDDAV